VNEKKAKIVELAEVKGIGPKTAKKTRGRRRKR